MWWFLNFFNLYKEIPLSVVLKDKKHKYFVIEIIPSEYLKEHHFVHATQISKLDIEKILDYYTKKNHLVINSEIHSAYYYYKSLKKLGFRNLYILKQ